MNTTFARLLVLIPFLLACNRDDKLPDETDTGTDTFGMYINDRLWTPYIPSPVTSIVSKKPTIQFYQNTSELLIEAQRIGDKNGRGFIALAARITGPGAYLFSHRAYRYADNCQERTHYSDTVACRSPYLLYDSASSQLLITKFDTAKKIVSGTFELTLKDSFQKILNIRNGRFDAHYTISE